MKKIAVVILVFLGLAAFLMMPFAHATLLIQSGWENPVGNPDITDGGIWIAVGDSTVVTSPHHGGTHSAQFTSSLAAECYDNNFGLIQSLTITAYVYFQNLPSTGKVDCVFVYDSHTNSEVSVGARYVNGVVYWSYDDNQDRSPSNPAPTTNTPVTVGVWHQITLTGVAGHPFTYSIWVDGNQIANNSPDVGYGCDSLNYVGVGGYHKSESVTVNVDDVTVEGTALGVFQSPEYSFGGLLAVAACGAAFAVFKWNQKPSRKQGLLLS